MRTRQSITRQSLLLFCLLLLSSQASGHEPGSDPPDASVLNLVTAVRLDDPLDFCGEPVPLNDRKVREGLEKELLLMLGNRPQVILWLKRAGRYLPYIENRLQAQGMPTDLKYVPVVESSLLSSIGSSKGAVGFWQFIKSTGRRYGLEINHYKDERRNLTRSTDAAIRYFKDLYEQFSSWSLAAAAYNLGEDRLQNEIELQGCAPDYYRIDLPRETERYLLKIIAVKRILAHPARYGFRLEPQDIYRPLATDQVILACDDRIPLRLVAEAAGSYFKEIRELNPELLRHFLPRGSHLLAIPKGAATGFNQRYSLLLAEWREKNSRITYVVKRGDNLSTIASHHNVTLAELRSWNNLASREYIFPGQRLTIYRY